MIIGIFSKATLLIDLYFALSSLAKDLHFRLVDKDHPISKTIRASAGSPDHYFTLIFY